MQDERQKAIDKVLTAKKESSTRRRYRAVAKGNEQIKWQASFDLERLSRHLIDPHEIAPFCDCESAEEILQTARTFALAFRHAKVDCLDIQAGEQISNFARRVAKLWYSVPVGSIMHFVSLRTLRFDDGMGLRRSAEFDFDKCWCDLPETNVAVDVLALEPIGEEMQVPQWELEGFASYADWREYKDEEDRKKKRRAELEASLRTKEEIDRDLNPRTSETTPQLFYKGVITEL